jgi:TPR repeat protein
MLAGLSYYNGQGVLQNYKTAVKWYTLGAEQGDAPAQSNLGTMYENGEGVLQDYVRAHMWFNIAASSGNKVASENRGIIAERMTPAKIAEAQQLA